MNRRPPVSKCTEKNPTDLLDYFLNTSFDVVKAVHDKLPLIEQVAADIEKLQFILDNLEELKVLMELAIKLATDEGASLIGSTDGKTVQEVLNELTDGKVDKIEGKGLSANDLTDLLLEKLEGIEDGAQVNVPTNLGLSQQSGSSLNITSSTGDDVLLEGATLIQAGLMTSTDKAKVDGIEDGAQVNVDTNLSIGSHDASSLEVTSSTGSPVTLPSATQSEAGLQSAQDKAKLDSVEEGAEVNVATNLGVANKTETSLDITSSTGSSVTLAEATIGQAGLLSSSDKVKLAEIEPNAQVNEATNLAVGNRNPNSLEVTSSTGSAVVLPSATTTQAGLLTSSEKNKLAAVEDGATANSTDAELRDRATHTGESPLSSVTGLDAALDSKVDKVEGQGLSQNNYTNDEKSKLAALESSLFLGVFGSLMELETTHPTATRAGEYAFIPGDSTYFMFVYDVELERWTALEGANAELTPAQLKTLYESNADTNAFTDALKSKLVAIQQGATANSTDAQLRDRSTHTGTQSIPTIAGLESALENKQPLNANLTALAAAVGAANKGIMFTGLNTIGTFDLSAQGRTFLAAATQAAQRTALGLGSAALLNADVFAQTFLNAANQAEQQSALGLVPVTSYLDRTPGRVAMLDPNGRGFHGLGNSQTVPVLDDFKGLNRTCFGLFTTGTLNGPPAGGNGGFMNIYANSADSGYQIMFAGTYTSDNRWAFGKKTNTSDPVWAEAWHDKNQLAIGMTALSARTALEINQGVVLSTSDFNSGLYVVTGEYTLPAIADSSFSNYPPSSPGLSRASLRVYSTGGYVTQELTTVYGRQFSRARISNEWSPWAESWDSRSLPVQSSITDTTSGAAILNGGHGLGASGIYRNSIDEVNLSRGSEFFINSAVPALNPFPAPYISGIHCCYGSPASGYAVQFVGGVTAHRYFVRYQTSGTWAAAVELWHTGNLTPNKLEDRTQATLPTASANKGQMFNCTNTTTRGERPVYSDGSVWRRLEDSSLITAA